MIEIMAKPPKPTTEQMFFIISLIAGGMRGGFGHRL
jgi:hypothetical protein